MLQSKSPKKVVLNLWDDYPGDEKTNPSDQSAFAYVENGNLPDDEEKSILFSLEASLQGWAFAHDQDVETRVEFHDSAKDYPKLVGTESEGLLYQRWQLNIVGLTHVAREAFVNHVKKIPLKKSGYTITLISES